MYPVKALSKVFRGRYISLVRKAFEKGELNLPGKIGYLTNPAAFSDLLSSMMAKKWIVFAKMPFKSPISVLDHLGRYNHRVAISNHRIEGITDKKVLFTYKERQ